MTFLPDDAEVGPHDEFGRLGPQDQDFVEYWWGLLYRQIQAMHEGPAPPPAVETTGPSPAADRDGLDITPEELEMIRMLEREEFHRDAAAHDIAAYQDSQDAAASGDGMALGSQSAMSGGVRVHLHGEVDSGSSRALTWTMMPGQTFCVRMRMDCCAADRMSSGVQTGQFTADACTQTEADVFQGRKRKRHDQGLEGADEEDAEAPDARGADGTVLDSGLRGKAEGTWSTALKGSAVVTIEDSQLSG